MKMSKPGLKKARAAFNMLQKVWKTSNITRSIKLQIFKTNVKRVLLDGSETWRRTKIM